MRTAGKGDVAVGIDHAGDDCGSTRIDDVDTRREIALIRAGTNPDHAACVGEKAHSCPQRWPGRVGQRRIPIQGRSRRNHRTTPRVVRSTPAFKDRVAEPDQRRGRLEPLRLREERPEPRVAVVLLMGLVIRGDDVKDVILDAASLLASAACTDETSLEEPTPARKVVPDRDLLGFERRFEVRCVIGGDSEDDRRGLGRDAFGFPRHASTMLERLLKSKAASNSGSESMQMRAWRDSPGPRSGGMRIPRRLRAGPSNPRRPRDGPRPTALHWRTWR